MYSYTDESGTIHITSRPIEGRPGKLIATSLKVPKGFKGPIDTGFQYQSVISGQARIQGLSKPLILAIIKTESNFNPRAVSPKGARGLMQLMPGTGRRYGVSNPFDPKQNIRAGTAYLGDMMKRFKNMDLALAAYNAGPGAVEKYGGIPPYDETRRYIRKVHHYYRRYSGKGGLLDLRGATADFDTGIRSLQRGDLFRAEENFLQVVRKYPKSSEANYNLALAYHRTGRHKKAAVYYRRATALDSYFEEAYYNLAIVYEQLERYSPALSTWKKYLKFEVRTDERNKVKKYMAELRQMIAQ